MGSLLPNYALGIVLSSPHSCCLQKYNSDEMGLLTELPVELLLQIFKIVYEELYSERKRSGFRVRRPSLYTYMAVCSLFNDLLEPLQYSVPQNPSATTAKRTLCTTKWNALLARTLSGRPELGVHIKAVRIKVCKKMETAALKDVPSHMLKNQPVSFWWEAMRVEQPLWSLCPKLRRVKVDCHTSTQALLLAQILQSQSHRSMDICLSSIDSAWENSIRNDMSLNIRRLVIESSLVSSTRKNGRLGDLPALLQSISSLEIFKFIFYAGCEAYESIEDRIILHDIIPFLLPQAATLETIFIARPDGGDLHCNHSIYHLSQFTRLKHLMIPTLDLANLVFEELPPSLEELQVQEDGKTWVELAITRRLRHLIEVKPKHLPKLRLVTLIAQERGCDFGSHSREYLMRVHHDLDKQFKQVGITFQISVSWYYWRRRRQTIVLADEIDCVYG